MNVMARRVLQTHSDINTTFLCSPTTLSPLHVFMTFVSAGYLQQTNHPLPLLITTDSNYSYLKITIPSYIYYRQYAHFFPSRTTHISYEGGNTFLIINPNNGNRKIMNTICGHSPNEVLKMPSECMYTGIGPKAKYTSAP